MGCQSARGGWTRVVIALLAVTIVAVAAAGPARASAAPLTEFNLPMTATARNLIDGPDGALYFAEVTASSTTAIGRITTAGTITSIPVGSTGTINDLAVGAGGAIWFTLSTHEIGELTAAGQIKLITPGMDGLNTTALPAEMTEGANGTVWFLDHATTKEAIGQITPSGQIIEYPTQGNDPDDLTVAADGDLWFTVFSPPPTGVGVAVPGATAGTPATVFPTGMGTMPAGITAGDDGNLWFSDQGTSSIGRVTPSGAVTEYGAADGMQPNADPDALIAGPDGNVWFDDQYSTNPAVGKITPAGQITEYPIAGKAFDLTVGIDGNIWLPTGNSDGTDTGVARVVPATGKIDIFSAGLNPGAVIYDNSNIVSGPDGNLWLIDIGKPYAIVRASVQLPPTVTTGAAANVTASSAQITGTANGRGTASTVTIQYGTTPASLGSTAAAGSEPADDTAGAVSATLTGLAAGTTVYYRLVATNAYGTVSGSTLSFTTVATPPPVLPPVLPPATRTLRATAGNQRVTVTLPTSSPCLAASARLPLKLSSTVISGSKAAKLSFKRAAVFIDRGVKHTRIKLVTVHHRKHRKRVTVYLPNATAGHLPATLSTSLRGQRSGTHALRVTLTYTRTRHLRHRTVGTTVTKTIKARFAVC